MLKPLRLSTPMINIKSTKLSKISIRFEFNTRVEDDRGVVDNPLVGRVGRME